MAENNSRNFNQAELKNARRSLQVQMRSAQIECDHRDSKGPTIESLRDTKEFVKDRDQHGELGVLCKQCKDTFSMESVTNEDIRKAVNTIYAMCNQAKLLFGASDADYEKIKLIMNFMDEFQATFVPYYNASIKALTNGQKKNKQNAPRQKGRLGLNSSQFSQR